MEAHGWALANSKGRDKETLEGFWSGSSTLLKPASATKIVSLNLLPS